MDGLTKRFGDFVAVDHIYFSVEVGEIFGLLGPNGAGKTTLIRMLTTLTPPTEGIARVAGFDVRKDADGVRNSIGVIPQALTSDPELTAEENMMIHAKLYGVPAGPARRTGARSAGSGGSDALQQVAGADIFRRHAAAPGNRARTGALAEDSISG